MDRGEDMGVMIDDAVPMPSARVVRRYPYEDMGVGQSFYVEGVQMQVVLNGNWRGLDPRVSVPYPVLPPKKNTVFGIVWFKLAA